MKCQRCNAPLSEMGSHDHHGQILCDDCYMDVLSPARSCDPWSVHSAKRLEASGGHGLQLNDVQQQIVRFLKEVGEADHATICEHLNIEPNTLQREIAALRHMEKVRGKPRDGKVVICLW